MKTFLLRAVAWAVGLVVGLWAGPWLCIIYIAVSASIFSWPWELVILGVYFDFLHFVPGRSIVLGLAYTISSILIILLVGLVKKRLRF